MFGIGFCAVTLARKASAESGGRYQYNCYGNSVAYNTQGMRNSDMAQQIAAITGLRINYVKLKIKHRKLFVWGSEETRRTTMLEF